MSFLDNLEAEQATLLIRLPYRAGLYISQADQTGGQEADAQEMRALAGIVEAFATEVFGCETMQYVITQTLARKADWPRWGDALAHVPDECARAVALLRAHVDPKEISGFTHHLTEIAEAVALAFREVGEAAPLLTRARLYLAWRGERRRKTRLGGLALETFFHISPDEMAALHALEKALAPVVRM